MSSGPDNVTQTTRTDPSPFLTGQIGQAAQQSGALASTSSQLGQDILRQDLGVDLLAARGLSGSPVTGAAQDLTTNTLRGDFLSPDTNPYLQQTFDRAADLTQTRLASEFGGAGRDLAASRPARSEELQTLSSNIFGGNFARERALQAGAVGQAIPLANQDFTDINALLDSSGLRLDSLINRIGALAPAAGGTAISSQPLTRNTGAGVLGGALSGASLAGMGALGPLGPVAGAIGGGILGIL